MKVHAPDHETLARLARVASAMLKSPLHAPSFLADLCAIEDDLSAAMRCAAMPSRVAATDGIALAAMIRLARGNLSQVSAHRLLIVLRTMLPEIEEHLFVATRDAAIRAARGASA